jgi:hypothetical protein
VLSSAKTQEFASRDDIDNFVDAHNMSYWTVNDRWLAQESKNQDIIDMLFNKYVLMKNASDSAIKEARDLLNNPPTEISASARDYFRHLSELKKAILDENVKSEIQQKVDELVAEAIRKLLANPPTENYGTYIDYLLGLQKLTPDQNAKSEIQKKVDELQPALMAEKARALLANPPTSGYAVYVTQLNAYLGQVTDGNIKANLSAAIRKYQRLADQEAARNRPPNTSGPSSNHTPSQQPASRSGESLEYELAILNAGGYVPHDDPSVRVARRLLDRLQAKFPESRQDISDTTVWAQECLSKNGVEVGIFELMQAILDAVPKEAEGIMNYHEAMAALMAFGYQIEERCGS